ncbi:hypothetical protein G9C98_000751 [Cotesia typhae]|uniref:Uncharacterized protein n=1 Tax=Cotesia typhae TaxID=2053667 RepID=A0A8J5QWW8_9HYME|nr:hypothetical protein G9C98_000751 [Cotesia typhae]
MRVLIVLISCAIAAAVPRCPSVRVIIDQNLASGTWYEFQRSDNNLITNGTCTTVIFHRSDQCICRMTYNNFPMSEKSLLAEIVPKSSDVFDYRFPLIGIYDQAYYIIDTNYIDYTVLMSCDQNYGRSGTFADGGLKCGRIIWNPPYAFNFTLTLKSISTITNEITSVIVEGNANSPTFRHHVPVLGIVDVDFTIFGVDYIRWMILYHCDNQGNTHNVNYEVFTRQQFPNEAELNCFIAQFFRSQGLQMPPFIMNNQNYQF